MGGGTNTLVPPDV